jgi:uncharacterized protein
MRINVLDIKDEEEITLLHDYDSKKVGIDFDDCSYAEPVHLSGSARRMKDSLFVNGKLTSTCTITCSFCLARSPNKVSESFDFIYDIKDKREVDITDDVREIFILKHPYQYRCKEDCKGLCPRCGTNLNEKTCRCPSDDDDTEQKFFQLKQWFEKKKEGVRDNGKSKTKTFKHKDKNPSGA